ncbi:MAG: hypothetical protein AAFN63_00920 [Pseudomonadota bacterium]
MRPLITSVMRFFVVLTIAVAMTGSSLAHRVAPADLDETMLAYVAAGGALEDLCGQPGFAQASQTCDACRLVDGAVVPVSGTTGLTERKLILQDGLRPTSNFVSGAMTNPSCPVRAPPVV